MPYAPRRSHPDLRASDAEREETVERLRVAATEGRIDADELDERLTSAYAARWRSELDALTADVTPPPPRAPVRVPFAWVAPAPRVTNPLSVLSFVSAIFLVGWLGWAAAIAAIVLGHAALYRIRRSGGRQKGRAWAAIGLSLGYLELVMLVVFGLAAHAAHML
jgi:hypothetical protein